jgi:meso-butanediol dehydrogenase / (S,S)-butanediol dehydrogenase / diacetyl reductase
MPDLDGRVAIVLGGAHGIGRASALALARRGARIWIADLDLAGAEGVRDEVRASGGSADAVRVDILDESSLVTAFDVVERESGRLDVCVNSAGLIAHDGERVFERNVEMLLVPVYRAMVLAIAAMRRSGGGAIVNVSSIAGVTGSIGSPGYGPAKHGVVGLTKDFALSTAADGIRVNAVCPGYVRTQQTERFAPDAASSERLITETLRVPLRRWGEPEEIGSVVAFLASDEASFMTGSIVVADGGLTAR